MCQKIYSIGPCSSFRKLALVIYKRRVCQPAVVVLNAARRTFVQNIPDYTSAWYADEVLSRKMWQQNSCPILLLQSLSAQWV